MSHIPLLPFYCVNKSKSDDGVPIFIVSEFYPGELDASETFRKNDCSLSILKKCAKVKGYVRAERKIKTIAGTNIYATSEEADIARYNYY